MLKTFFRTLALSILSICTFAQSPDFQVKDADSSKVRMNELKIDVKIVGNIAYTNVEMHFSNVTNREMEGELLFPLPEGISVSHYAIDIDGKMRSAVPVKKSKGKQVFEAIQNRRVDPGLLEKVEGNNFRTRVYPIPAGGKRIVQIGYEEELKLKDTHNLAFRFLSNYPHKLDVFKMEINILGSIKTPVIEGGQELRFTSWNQNYSTSFERNNYLPKENVEMLIPVREEIPAVFAQRFEGNNYFYTQFFIDNKIMPKKNPKSIGIIFDNSLSARNRNIDKELEFLQRYFEHLKDVSVSLFFLNYDFKKQQDFTIRNGQADSLLNLLKNSIYDGGTRYSKINLPPMDEYLFFTDGFSSLSDKDFELPQTPLYTISSSASADHSYLNKVSTDTSGDFINLGALSVDDGLHKLMQQSLRFLGVKDNLFVTEVYPAAGTLVGKSFSIAGISLKGKNEVTLLFGYGNQPSIEKKIMLDVDAQQNHDVNIFRLWAQKKIAYLDRNYDENQEAIEILGNKAVIATRNTSLIVLETLNDYIRYEIIPPAELRADYDRVMKERRESLAAREQSNLKDMESSFKNIKEWWDKDISYTEEKKTKLEKSVSTSMQQAGNKTVRGVVSDNEGGLPGANVTVKGTTRGAAADFEGNFEVRVSAGETLVFSYLGMQTREVSVTENTTTVNVTLIEDDKVQLDELVVVAYGTIKKSDVTGALESVSEEQMRKSVTTSIDQALQGLASGVQVSESQRQQGEASSVRIRGASSMGNNEPLYVIDGVPVTEGDNPLASVNPADIESIEVLKDASSTAIYSSRTASNVIMITTKKGMPEADSLGQVQQKTHNAATIIATTDPHTAIDIIKSQPKEKQYGTYLKLREKLINNPAYYFETAYFFKEQGDNAKALLILSSIADLGLENYSLYKTLTCVFREWGANSDALYTARQVAKWRNFEPQSFRDLALTLEDNGKRQEAFDMLIKSLKINYLEEMEELYSKVETVTLMDINRMMIEYPELNTSALDKEYLIKMPVDLRVVLSWNLVNTDIDLHVIEPSGEECYYSKTSTRAGGHFSEDFMEGYGPEQYLLRNKLKGKYIIKSNFYGEDTMTETGPASVFVEIYTRDKKGKIKREYKTILSGKVKQNDELKIIEL